MSEQEVDPRWDMTGGLWTQDKGDQRPRFIGNVQIDGVIYAVEGWSSSQYGPKSDKAPNIRLKLKVKDDL